MESKDNSKFKKVMDNILIYNLYILIIGAFSLFLSFILSMNGYSNLYNLFRKLWYPFFIPSLSLFFTAILVEATVNQLKNTQSK